MFPSYDVDTHCMVSKNLYLRHTKLYIRMKSFLYKFMMHNYSYSSSCMPLISIQKQLFCTNFPCSCSKSIGELAQAQTMRLINFVTLCVNLINWWRLNVLLRGDHSRRLIWRLCILNHCCKNEKIQCTCIIIATYIW